MKLFSHRRLSISTLGASLALLTLQPAATANFALLDDFETYPAGDISGDATSPWTPHANTGLFSILAENDNQFLGFAWSDGLRAGSRSLPAEMEIRPGDKATLFLQFRAGSLGDGQSSHFGLAHNVDTTAHAPATDFRVETVLRPGPSADQHTLEVRDGVEWRTVATVTRGLWYNLWYVIDRAAGDTFQVYLTTGEQSANTSHLLGYDDNGSTLTNFSFRDGGSATDILNGFLAYGSATSSRSIHLDNLWIDSNAENLAFVGADLDAWQFAFEPLPAPFNLKFGMGATDEDGESLIRRRPADFGLQFDALQYIATADALTSSAAMASAENLLPRQNFTLTAGMSLQQLQNVGPHRVGLAVLGTPHTPIDAPFNPENNNSFYGLVWFPAADGSTSLLQIRRGFSGEILEEAVWQGLHPSLANLGQGGIGAVYTLKAQGTYDASGLLNLTFNLVDTNGFSQSISTVLFQPLQGNLFGFGGHVSTAVNPRFDFHSLSLTVGGEPGPILDPVIQWPFSLAFGSDEGRASNESFRQNHPEEWSLEPQTLRLSTSNSAYRSSLSSSWVFNYDPSEPFALRMQTTLQNLAAQTADNRIGLVLFGDSDREVFDADNADTYYSLQFIPNDANAGHLVLRQGMNGTILAALDFADLPNPPSTNVGSTYDLTFTGLFKANGNLVFIANLTDQNGGQAEMLGEVENPIGGSRFGFGAWHRAAENPTWDIHELAMAPPSGVGNDAPYSDNDMVIGFAVREQDLTYAVNGGTGRVGSLGNADTRRHENPVIGFMLPEVPLDKIVRFELTITRATGRDDRAIDLYGLLPVDPSTYSDGSITPTNDGIDVWYQGTTLDDREGLIGGSWATFIPQGTPVGTKFSQDVTDFVASFYDENGPTQEKVFFRLSPGAQIGLTTLARNTIEHRKDQANSPRLSYVVFPPVEPDSFNPFPFEFAFGTGADRDGLGDFSRNIPGEWSLLTDSIRLSTSNPSYHNSLQFSQVIDFQPGIDFGIRSRMTLSGLDSGPNENRVGLVLFGERDRNTFDPDDDQTYYTFQWLPNSASGAKIAVRRGMSGDIVAETPFSGLSNPPQTTVGTTYTFEVHGFFTEAGALNFKAILTDGNGGEAVAAGTIPAPLADKNRFGFGARHSSDQNPAWDFHDLSLIEGRLLDYEPLEAPLAFDFGSGTGKDSGTELLVDRPQDWSLQDNALRYARTEPGVYISSVHSALVSNYVTGQDFTVEAEFTLRSMAADPAFERVSLALLGDSHEPFDNPFSATAETNFHGVSWFPTGTLRIADGLNTTRAQVAPGIPVTIDGVYQMKAEGVYLAGGELEVTFTLTHAGVPYSISHTFDTPTTGNMFGFGGRSWPNGNPAYDFHSFSVTLGDVPEPPAGQTFEIWRAAEFEGDDLNNPAISGPLATPAGDGVTNLVKYAMDLDPRVAIASGDLFLTKIVDGELRLSYLERNDVLDIEYIVEVSQNLVNWDTGPAHVEEIGRDSVTGNLDDVTVRALLPGETTRGFMRLTIQTK